MLYKKKKDCGRVRRWSFRMLKGHYTLGFHVAVITNINIKVFKKRYVRSGYYHIYVFITTLRITIHNVCPRLLLQFWRQTTEGNLLPGRQAVEGWVGVLIGSCSVGRKEEFALSCQTPCSIEAYMVMGRVEYTCSLLLGKMLILLLHLLYKLLRLEAGLKASGFMASHYFFGFSLIQCSHLFVCHVFVFSSYSANMWSACHVTLLYMFRISVWKICMKAV